MAYDQSTYESAKAECLRLQAELDALHASLEKRRQEINQMARRIGKPTIAADPLPVMHIHSAKKKKSYRQAV